MDVHLDALEHAARDLREYSAAAPKSELYQDLARCISSLVTWLLPACRQRLQALLRVRHPGGRLPGGAGAPGQQPADV